MAVFQDSTTRCSCSRHVLRLSIEYPLPKANKKARFPGPCFIASPRSRNRPDVGRLLAFGASRDVERHLLVLLQRFEAAVLDRREMREQILPAAIRRDEAVTFRVIEPLDCTRSHSKSS